MEKIDQVKELLEQRKYKEIRDLLTEENDADVAVLLEELDTEDMIRVFRLLPKDSAADVFVYMSNESGREVIESLTNVEIGNIVNDLYSDDVIDMLEELPANVVKRVLAASDAETRRDINHLLKYPEDSAGSHMNVEFVDLRAEMTVSDAISRIREIGVDKETINTCYVMDKSRHMLGVITLRKLLLSGSNELIGDIMNDNVISVHTLTDQEEVALEFQKYDLTVMPVVDNENRLVGIITVDDVVDIMLEETTEDIEKMAAITPGDKPYIKTGPFETYKKRIPWLLILMISASITGKIIQGYEHALASYVILTSFIPMLMDTGGNSGSQASVSVIRAISLNEIKLSDTWKIVWKELRVSILVGGTLAVANFAKVLIIDQTTVEVALVICSTLWFTVIIAKLVGCLLPIIANKIGFDPAIMASPFITTIVDALSLVVYFTIAAAILGI
ncbi:MAG: magnesium transporter [Coprobacillaceae bacterium]